jgi:hypothetical protein
MAGKSQFGLWIPPLLGTSFLPIGGRIVSRIGRKRPDSFGVADGNKQTLAHWKLQTTESDQKRILSELGPNTGLSGRTHYLALDEAVPTDSSVLKLPVSLQAAGPVAEIRIEVGTAPG